ncbi:uncharacterized protein LOC110732538 [Chenopodium quinoa]|uniref:uncharacterized protein LOC110732538 n=1 Tax=Chenopodium quinoa TaxID=63459 RepID=UPI000B784C0D|nr:uncharacterized protein LOC110732538 [Chenopodium quinoa]
MDGNLRKSLSSNSMYSLNSRLDHLDSTIKYLEDRKCSSTRWTNDGAGHGVVNRNCVPIDLAVMEAQSKGSILDRITSLEERLIQVCSLIESEAALSPSKNSQDETSPRISRKGFSNSFSRFRLPRRSNNKQPISRTCMDKPPVTEGKEHKKSKGEKSSPKHKKLDSSSLLHLRLLGCS